MTGLHRDALPDARQAADMVEQLERIITSASGWLAEAHRTPGRDGGTRLDDEQALAYDVASVSAAVRAARAQVDRSSDDATDALLALVFAASTATDTVARLASHAGTLGVADRELLALGRAAANGSDAGTLDRAFAPLDVDQHRPMRLDGDLALVRDTFRRVADEIVAPIAEDVHRNDRDVPDDVIRALAELGCFGLSIPEAYGGVATDDSGLLHSLIVTEELSRASLSAGGSLITRPEIVGAAILRGGTEDQRARWLPRIATGEAMCAVAVTEPDHGSDVSQTKLAARPVESGWTLNGTKTWCTFAGRAELLLVLARTEPEADPPHRGLSLFVVEKPAQAGTAFEFTQPTGGRMVGRAIPTIGYRGMHSYEVVFESWRVPEDALLGGPQGRGRGFYTQLEAFAPGRLQTAARAQGVMGAAIDAAVRYSRERHVFGRRLADLPLTRAKLARMTATLRACQALSLSVAADAALGAASTTLGAAQAKQLACRSAEWVTREAQQIHGGYGYAEEYAVSRYFVDARVLSIFEGADEVLALRVIARHLRDLAPNA